MNEASVSSKKKILMYAHYYIPDVASTGQVCADLAEGLSNTFDVTVICVVPSYTGKIDEKYKDKKKKFFEEDINGVRVVRVKVPEFDKSSKKSRILNIVSYYRNAKKATRMLGDFDYVFSISQPPILGGMLGIYGSKKKHAKFIYNIQDFNPEQVLAVGYSHNRLITDFMMKMDKKSCLKSDLIITVGRDLVETVNKRFEKSKKKPRKVVMINNWIDEKTVYPLKSDDEGVVSFKKQYGLEDKFIFMYSGNIGLYYDLEGLFGTIKKIKPGTKSKDGREVVFAFVGAGSLLTKLKTYKEEHKMDNVVFIPYQDKDKLIYSLNAADVHFCVSAKGIKGVSCPSKYYGIAAVAKPVLAVLEHDSEIGMIIKESGSGFCSEPKDYDMLLSNLNKYIDMDGSNTTMGDNGYTFLKRNLTKGLSVQKYNDVIREL